MLGLLVTHARHAHALGGTVAAVAYLLAGTLASSCSQWALARRASSHSWRASTSTRARSFRLGISLMAIGPLTAATIAAVQKELQARLKRLANLDRLTGALSRSAYLRGSTRLLAAPGSRPEAGIAVVMVTSINSSRSMTAMGMRPATRCWWR